MQAQRPSQRAFVPARQQVEAPFRPVVDDPVSPAMIALQKRLPSIGVRLRRRSRNRIATHDSYGKFVQQPAYDALHEEHRDENGHQRKRHRRI